MIVYLHDYVSGNLLDTAEMPAVPAKDNSLQVKGQERGVMFVEWKPDANYAPSAAPQGYVPHVYLFTRAS